MGIKDFFKNAWGKVKNAARVGYNFVKDKVIPNVGRIAKVGMNIMSNLPGKLGAIGKIGTHVINTVGKVVDHIPNDRLRDKIKAGLGFTNDKLNQGVEKVTSLVQRGNDLIDKGKQAYTDFKDGVQNMPRMPTLK